VLCDAARLTRDHDREGRPLLLSRMPRADDRGHEAKFGRSAKTLVRFGLRSCMDLASSAVAIASNSLLSSSPAMRPASART
jgi:hypothetical protein